jgi:hypothetical protein
MPDFCRLSDGRILDLRPSRSGRVPLIFDSGTWRPVTSEDGITVGKLWEGKPITAEEAAALIKKVIPFSRWNPITQTYEVIPTSKGREER